MRVHIKILLAALMAVTVTFCTPKGSRQAVTAVNGADTLSGNTQARKDLLYGIPVDSLDQITGHIKPNNFLSDILKKHGISMSEIDRVLKNSKSVFDVRKMREGNDFVLYCDRDSSEKAKYFLYEHDPQTIYIFSFNDSLNITMIKKEVRSEVKFASGTIETSLWDAMIDGGLHAGLVSGLSEIFAWTVDFFGLQKGDNFKVIYEELYIGDKYTGTGRIYGAQFTRSGKAIIAIPFIQDGKESYYDAEGNSMKKAFLKAPLEFARITSHFSSGRMHPILRIRRPHFGVDYAAPVGTPVHSIGDGRVVSMTTDASAGRMVKIQHNSVFATAYLHLSRFGEGIAPGAVIRQNDIVGYVGSSGLSTGPHLDFRFYENGSPVDPLKVDAPPVEPVKPENLQRFGISRRVIEEMLTTID